jgi:hypothetical protein
VPASTSCACGRRQKGLAEGAPSSLSWGIDGIL